jgi:hypothetical protein
MRRTIKFTNRQAEMVCATFVGNEKDEHYSDDEIRELVVLMWEWQWGVGRCLLDAIGISHTDGALDQPGVTYPMTTSSQLRSASRAR